MSSAIEPFATFDIRQYAAWLKKIPVGEWPGMADPAWHGADQRFRALSDEVEWYFAGGGREVSSAGLFLLSPGQEHPLHTDQQAEIWLTRVHIPIVTNQKAVAMMKDATIHMAAGVGYCFDTTKLHGVRNGGSAPRVHFVCDIVQYERIIGAPWT